MPVLPLTLPFSFSLTVRHCIDCGHRFVVNDTDDDILHQNKYYLNDERKKNVSFELNNVWVGKMLRNPKNDWMNSEERTQHRKTNKKWWSYLERIKNWNTNKITSKTKMYCDKKRKRKRKNDELRKCIDQTLVVDSIVRRLILFYVIWFCVFFALYLYSFFLHLYRLYMSAYDLKTLHSQFVVPFIWIVCKELSYIYNVVLLWCGNNKQ